MAVLKNPKHELFCQEYMIDMIQTRAYIRAGYAAKNADVHAARLMVNGSIRARIDELLAERSSRTGVTADRVIRELARIGFIKAADVINMKDATVKEDADDDDMAAISSVKVKETFGDYPSIEREVKLCDKGKALELLGRHLGMFKDDINLNVNLPKILDDIGAGKSG